MPQNQRTEWSILHSLGQLLCHFLKHESYPQSKKMGLPVRDREFTNGETVGLRRQLRQKSSQFGCGFELGNGIQFLECAGERIRQAPHRPRRELLVLRLEIEPVHFGEKSTWRFQLAIHERGIENQLRPFVGDLRLPPLFHLASHRVKASLDPIDTNG